MNIIHVHYHRRPSGVNRVIQLSLTALKNHDSISGVILISGENLPELHYRDHTSPGDGTHLADLLQSHAQKHFPDPSIPRIWHFHNPFLGKNSALSTAATLLANQNQRILLQTHDFAEDNRPKNFQQLRNSFPDGPLYPHSPRIHHAVVNRRDFQILLNSGLPTDRIHLIPNPISEVQPHIAANFKPRHKLLLSPTRGPERKNWAELLLLSQITPPTHTFATTGPPTDTYWPLLARKLRLPIEFHLTSRYPLPAIWSRADSLITTSVAEGFGMTFLEPWLSKKAVVGRNIPEITSDFTQSNIDLNHLYSNIPIPTKHFDVNTFHTRRQQALVELYHSYNRPLPEDAFEISLATTRSYTGYDFAKLDKIAQTQILESNPKSTQITPPQLTCTPETISANASAIHQHFSTNSYTQHMLLIYYTLAQSPATPLNWINSNTILDHFLLPSRFPSA